MPAKMAIFPLLLVLVLTTSCTNPFTTRDPEEPDSARQSWIQPRQPELVLDNLRNSILEMNIDNYLRSLSDTSKALPLFKFIPAPDVAAENPGVFMAWTKENERSYFTVLGVLTPADSLHFISFKTNKLDFSGEAALIIANYTLRIHHTQQAQGIPAVVQGEARFTLMADTFGDWAIVEWQDISTEEAPTWSVFKANYGQ
ncbi:MAG: hypothetical protein DWQ05_05400 [Calditrichaeota bacterium]|nr:MAG: hypothetical protein DWQ05_05400 [Calditrichota bacterium]